jgi:hypothetical protein
VVPGRPGLEVIRDTGVAAQVQLDVTGLNPWAPPAGVPLGLGDRLDLCSPDADDWVWGIDQAVRLVAGATSAVASIDLLRSGDSKVPMFGLDAAAGDRLFLLQQSERRAPGGQAYQVAVRSLVGAPVTLTNGRSASLAGAFADVSTIAQVSVDWQFDAWEAALLADMNPAAILIDDRFMNRFRVVGQPGGLQFGSHEFIQKADLLALPVASGTGRVATGAMDYGVPNQGAWGTHWIATVDRVVGVGLDGTIGGVGPQGYFGTSIRTMAATSPSVALPAPIISLARNPRAGGQDLFAPLGGVGLAPTFSWDPPTIGVPDMYTLMIVRFEGVGSPPRTVVAELSTTGTSIELPPGILEAGRRYIAILRATKRALVEEAPLRVKLPISSSIQVTMPFGT